MKVEKNLLPGAPNKSYGLAELVRVTRKLVGEGREDGYRLLGLPAVDEALGIKSDDRRVVVAALCQHVRDRCQQTELALIAQGFRQGPSTLDNGIRR